MSPQVSKIVEYSNCDDYGRYGFRRYGNYVIGCCLLQSFKEIAFFALIDGNGTNRFAANSKFNVFCIGTAVNNNDGKLIFGAVAKGCNI